MKRLLALLLMLPSMAFAGGLSRPGTAGSTGPLIDTYFIYPDHQAMTRLEATDSGFSSPWGQLTAGNSDLESIANWICDHRDTYNIKAVLGMGDVVNTATSANYEAFAPFVLILDACGLPFLPAYGNHEGHTGAQPQSPDDTTDATLYHGYLGQGDAVGSGSPMDAKGWFAGSRADRPDWVEEFAPGQSSYLEDTGVYKSRSFWVPVPPFNIMAPEWDYSIRISQAQQTAESGDWDGNRESNASSWVRELKAAHPNDYWIHMTHAGPCENQNCDLTPRSLGNLFGPKGGDWGPEIEDLGPNVVAFLNGHWGGGSQIACWAGGGVYTNAVRDDGSHWVAGMFDFNCGTRQDPSVAGNNCPDDGVGPPTGACPGPDCWGCQSNPYTWQGWLVLKRESREICLNTIRTIDVDSDDDGTPDAGVATLLTPPELDRGTTYGDPDVTEQDYIDRAADNARLSCNDFDSGPGAGDIGAGCPNHAETCITIQEL